MKTRMVQEREGEDVGPVDWEHPWAKELPADLRATLQEAEKDPGAFVYCPSGFSTFRLVSVCMYDGWPYWKPGPALAYVGPLGCIEWAWFNSYGVGPRSVHRGKPWGLADGLASPPNSTPQDGNG